VNVLIICRGSAYGDERSYNGLRLAGALAKRDGTTVKVFLIGDGVTCAIAGQKVPDGYYHLDRMITVAGHHDTEIGCCATCMDARGIADDHLIAPSHRATLEDLADWVLWATRPSRSERADQP
jgi:uncharacterized protein involved in oxidation of intracellular sulfur